MTTYYIQVYKILKNIGLVDKEKLFTTAEYRQTRGHQYKLLKHKSRFKNGRANSFSNRVVKSWNALPENFVNAPSLNLFKSRLNKHWYGHPNKFEANATRLVARVQTQVWNHIEMHLKRSEAYYGVDYR